MSEGHKLQSLFSFFLQANGLTEVFLSQAFRGAQALFAKATMAWIVAGCNLEWLIKLNLLGTLGFAHLVCI